MTKDDQALRAEDGRSVARLFRRGDAGAVQSVRRRVRRILAFRGYRMPVEERRDLEQEAMKQLWSAANRPGFDPEGGFWGLVEAVTVRRRIDWVRTQRQSETILEDHPDGRVGPFERVVAAERASLATRTLAKLDRPCRELIYDKIALDKSYAEIARLAGKTEGALRVQMHRCIGKARDLLMRAQAPPSVGRLEVDER